MQGSGWARAAMLMNSNTFHMKLWKTHHRYKIPCVFFFSSLQKFSKIHRSAYLFYFSKRSKTLKLGPRLFLVHSKILEKSTGPRISFIFLSARKRWKLARGFFLVHSKNLEKSTGPRISFMFLSIRNCIRFANPAEALGGQRHRDS